MSRKRKFSEKQEIEICAEYFSDENPSTIILAKKWSCSKSVIRNIIFRNCGELRSPKEAHNTESCKQLQKQNNSVIRGEMCGEKNPAKRLEVRKVMSKSHKGEKNFMFGKHIPCSEEHKRKIGDKNRGKYRSKKTKEKMSKSALLRIKNNPGPFIDTKPELEMKKILNELNIVFEHQFRLKNHLYDFRIVNTNILIEVDGDYFHSNPKKFQKLNTMQLKQRQRDIRNTKLAKDSNFILLRFWESDILKNAEIVKEQILKEIYKI